MAINIAEQLTGSEYMTLRRQKLDGANADVPKLDSLFRGLCFYVNGHTEPSQNELRELVCQHGGHFVYHHAGSEVTHVLANQLSNTKLVKLKPTDHVISPQWVLDCIAKGRRLPESRYEIARSGADGGDLRAMVANAAASAPSAPEALPPAPGSAVAVKKEHKAMDANDPDFLKQFFAMSRLHHLSAWRTAFQEELADELGVIDTNSSQYRKRERAEGDYSVIMHVDMDCFFASVAMRHDPSLIGKPVAVCHDKNHGEVSACNYEARKFKISSGMFVEEAKKLCPDLVCVPYQFELYEQTSRALFGVLRRYTQQLEIVSCDEAFIDVSDCSSDAWDELQTEDDRANAIASRLRGDIYDATGCHASIGVSFNMLLARMATSKAKPNGQYLIAPENALAFLSPVSVSSIPGVGYKTQKQLKELQVETCGQLQEISLEILEGKCGKKKAEKLKMYSRGVCSRQIQPRRRRKSIGVDVNYGIRFDNQRDVLMFIDRMCKEVIGRLGGREGKQVTLKLMLKRDDWKTPSKFMGHGSADTKQKSVLLDRYFGDLATIASHAKQLYRNFGIKDDTTLVGIGMSIGKLKPVDKPTEAPKSLFKDPAPKKVASDVSASSVVAETPKRVKYVDLEMEELDLDVLNELPAKERREILEAIQERKWKKGGQQPPQPTGGGGIKEQLEKQQRQPKRQGKLAVTKSQPASSAAAPPPAPSSVRSNPIAAALKREAPRRSYQTIDSSQIDAATLAELPPDIQAMFMAELDEVESKKNLAPKKKAKHLSPEQERKADVAAEQEVGTEADEDKTSIFSGRYSQWRHLFPLLLRSSSCPDADAMVEALTRYLIELVNGYNLEDARLLLYDFERHVDIVEEGDEGWKMVWNSVLSTVQQHLIETHGAVLNFELK